MAGERLKQSTRHGEKPGPHEAAEVEKWPAKRTQVGTEQWRPGQQSSQS